jgi:pimeloyl-ACP methyl ester carboxylesterase
MMVFFWIFLILVFAAVALFVTAYIFSNTIIHGRRQPIVHTPKEYGMAYEDVEFPASDGLRLKGWFIPAAGENRRAIIITHPLPFNRHGFLAKNQGFPPLAFTDVDLLKTAQALHAAGYPLLMFDFRNHGESESKLTGVGLEEYRDVLGALAYLRQRQDLEEPQIGFVSFCMGANSTVVALSKGKQQVDDVKFLVAIQPVSALVFIRSYLKAVYTPLSLVLMPILDWIVQRRGGHPLAAMTPLPYTKDLGIPTLYIQAKHDRWTELSDTQQFYDATPEPKTLWWIEEKINRFEAYNYIGQHPERVIEFARNGFE